MNELVRKESVSVVRDTEKRKKKLKTESSLWWMYLPGLVIITVFIIYPFTNWNGFSQTYDWIGLQQYKRLLADPTTWLVIKNTLLYGIGSTIFQNIIGLLYALLLNQSIKM